MKEMKIAKNDNGGKKKGIAFQIFDWVICIAAAFLAALLIKYFIFTPTLVKQTSMYPTIEDGERVLINRLVRTFNLSLSRGDIITFAKPDYTDVEKQTGEYNEITSIPEFFIHDVLELTKTSFIKRVIAFEGEHIVISNGSVYVDDRKLEEVYLDGITTPKKGEFCDVVVPEGYIFVMGDNRSGSSDSRAFGCIPLSAVEGRVSIRIWPLNRFGKIDD